MSNYRLLEVISITTLCLLAESSSNTGTYEKQLRDLRRYFEGEMDTFYYIPGNVSFPHGAQAEHEKLLVNAFITAIRAEVYNMPLDRIIVNRRKIVTRIHGKAIGDLVAEMAQDWKRSRLDCKTWWPKYFDSRMRCQLEQHGYDRIRLVLREITIIGGMFKQKVKNCTELRKRVASIYKRKRKADRMKELKKRFMELDFGEVGEKMLPGDRKAKMLCKKYIEDYIKTKSCKLNIQRIAEAHDIEVHTITNIANKLIRKWVQDSLSKSVRISSWWKNYCEGHELKRLLEEDLEFDAHEGVENMLYLRASEIIIPMMKKAVKYMELQLNWSKLGKRKR